MNVVNVMTNVLAPAIDACWNFFNSLWTSLPGSVGFFLAIFTMVTAIRLFVMPLVGYHRTYARNSAEERPSGYQDRSQEIYTSSYWQGRY